MFGKMVADFNHIALDTKFNFELCHAIIVYFEVYYL